MTSAAAIPTVTLNDDNTMPVIGLGVGELSETETEQAVSAALETGYRLIDTASAYGNEAAVGRAVAASGIPATNCSSPPSWRPKTWVSSPPRTRSGSAWSGWGWTTWTCS